MAKTPKFDLASFAPKKAADVGIPRSMLFYGPPKRGKSTCAASIIDVPGYERVLVIDVEGGAAAISEWYPEVDVQEVSTAEEFDGLVEALVTGQIVQPSSGLPYQCVIIDTLDKAFDRKLEWADKQPGAVASSGSKDHYFKWNVVKTWMLKLADLVHMAPFLTIFVAHVMEDKDDKGKVTQTVALGGASKQTFPATPDVVGYFDIAKVKSADGKTTEMVRTLDFSLNDKRVTGQRYANKLNGSVADPTMEKIYRKIAPHLFAEDTTSK